MLKHDMTWKNFVKTLKGEFKRQPFKIGLLVLCALLLIIVEAWDYMSPLPTHEWLANNLKNIKVGNPEDFYFAIFGDNKNSFAMFDDLLKRVNSDPDIAFAVDLGDMVYDGEKEKYRHFFNQLSNLHRPLLTAIGNHELKENGRGFYYDIFGPYYYSFQIGNHYFIVLDTADGKGPDFWQRRWLEAELTRAQSCKTRLVFMHVPLFDPRGGIYHHCLPDRDGQQLAELFQKYHITHIFASHIHGYFQGQWQGVPYTISGGAGAELWGIDPQHYFYHFLKVHVKDGSVKVQVQKLPSPEYEWLDRLRAIVWLYLYAFIRIHGIEMALFLCAAGLLLVAFRSRMR